MSDEKKSAEETIEEGMGASVEMALNKLTSERGEAAEKHNESVLRQLAKVAFINGVYRGFMTGALEVPGDEDFNKLVADIERLQPSVKGTARWVVCTRERPMSKDFELGFAVALAAADFDEKFILKALSEAHPEDT